MTVLMLRTLLLYLSVLFSMRLMGKRQLGELQPGELVSTILISNLASVSIESTEVPIAASLVPLFLITAVEIINSALSFKFRPYADFVQGKPKTVIRDGIVDQNILRQLRLSTADLLEALRAKDIFDPRQVSWAVVETNGTISAAKRTDAETVTLTDLSLAPNACKAFVPFMLEGQILQQNLAWCGKTEQWLQEKLQAEQLTPKEVLALIGNDTEDICLIRLATDQEGSQ